MASVQRANVLSPSSELSYSMLSSATVATSILDDTSSDGGDIVYDISDDDDYVLIPHARIPQQETASIEYAMFRLDITTPEPELTTPTKYHKAPKDRRSTVARPKREGKPKLASGAPAPVSPKHSSGRDRRKRGKRDIASSPATSPERELTEEALFFDYDTKHALVVESDAESEYALMKYEGAKSFITSFLSNPSVASAYTRLTFLQSLIIELGLISPTSDPPSSMNAAKRIIKSRAFVNIGDYLYAREKGPIELENIKFKNRKALTNDLKKNKGRRQTDRRWAKRHGLNVLLVSVM